METHWCAFKTPLSPDAADSQRVQSIILSSTVRCVKGWRGNLHQTKSGFPQIYK